MKYFQRYNTLLFQLPVKTLYMHNGFSPQDNVYKMFEFKFSVAYSLSIDYSKCYEKFKIKTEVLEINNGKDNFSFRLKFEY